MTIKERDRRKMFWASVGYIMTSPLAVYIGADIEMMKFAVMTLGGLGVANYFSKPSKD